MRFNVHVPDTTPENEQAYLEHVVNFAKTNPLTQAVYIFEAFDESEKPGSETERHFGVMVTNTIGRNPNFSSFRKVKICEYIGCQILIKIKTV